MYDPKDANSRELVVVVQAVVTKHKFHIDWHILENKYFLDDALFIIFPTAPGLNPVPHNLKF